MTDNQLIERAIKHKLDYVRMALANSGQAKSGSRDKLRERLKVALAETPAIRGTLQRLVQEHDRWGNQSISFYSLSPSQVDDLQKVQDIREKVRRLQDSLHREIAESDTPEKQVLTPPDLDVEIAADASLLRVTATRKHVLEDLLREPEPYQDKNEPDVMWKAFRQTPIELTSMVEVRFQEELVMTSEKRIFTKGNLQRFSTFIRRILADALSVTPQTSRASIAMAIANLNDPGFKTHPLKVVKARRKLMNFYLEALSETSEEDIRSNPDLSAAMASLTSAPNWLSNCYWSTDQHLKNRVHTVLFAKDDSITILGEAEESDVRCVLDRILEVNS